MAKLVFVDCEATGPCPGIRVLTEFGAVDYGTRRTFHGVLHDSEPDPANPAQPVLTGRAYDAAEVFGGFRAWLDGLGEGARSSSATTRRSTSSGSTTAFGMPSGRTRSATPGGSIGNYYAGLVGDFRRAQDWKRFRVNAA
jgi:hypothetical protein